MHMYQEVYGRVDSADERNESLGVADHTNEIHTAEREE
jgi:hypothetical protein